LVRQGFFSIEILHSMAWYGVRIRSVASVELGLSYIILYECNEELYYSRPVCFDLPTWFNNASLTITDRVRMLT
jgi:hypothetical protein